MAEVLHFPSSPTIGPPSSSSSSSQPFRCDPQEEAKRREEQSRDQLSFLALLVTVLRKSLAACKSDRKELGTMDIGWPTNVRHVAHVTFDRFNGFSGLPVEFEPEVPRRPPSASATVFGVSTESMQLSYDSRGNSVPTILLLMQRRLYDQGGLQAEGIFRINAENSQEEYVRNQLNTGVVEGGIDVHCLAGLIKAWFRELPTGVLDSLSTEQVMQCQTEEQCAELARLLPPTEASLLDWSINLMADVAQQEHLNKMNASNIAMVFAPNMTQMADPLTALMYVVQVMNFLKTLIVRTLRERRDSVVEPTLASRLEPNDGNGDRSALNSIPDADTESEETEQVLMAPNLVKGSPTDLVQSDDIITTEYDADYPPKSTACIGVSMSEAEPSTVNILKGNMQINSGQSSRSSTAQELRKLNQQPSEVQTTSVAVKTKGMSNLSRIDSWIDQSEAWR